MEPEELPPGPWKDEPNRVEFQHAGLPCILRRGPLGTWCGYAAVPPGHPLHGTHYGDVDSIDVHGGLTYSDACQGEICHVPAPGEPDDVWWFGFDCGHFNDLVPAMIKIHDGIFGVYRDVNYARKETEALADQLAAATA